MYFSPQCIEGKMKFVLDTCGINSASTFYGYCTEHEKLFSSIDFGNFNTKYDIILQCFRSVGFWISEESHAHRYIDDSYSIEYKLALDKNHAIDIKNIMHLYNALHSCIENSEKYDVPLKLKNQIEVSKNWKILHAHLDYELPIALCTKNPYSLDGMASNIMWIVVPLKDSTELIVIYSSTILDEYVKETLNLSMQDIWEKLTNDNLIILNMVEAAMMSNAMWWIKPSVLNNISNEKKDTLVTDLRYRCFFEKVWQEVKYSIFDDLRRKFILEENNLAIRGAETSKLDYKFTFLTKQEEQELESEIFKKLRTISELEGFVH